MRFLMTPFDLAWSGVKKTLIAKDKRVNVFACPDCEMPIDPDLQKSNIRVEEIKEEKCYILSCPWCYRVFNIGTVEKVDKSFIIAKKEVE